MNPPPMNPPPMNPPPAIRRIPPLRDRSGPVVMARLLRSLFVLAALAVLVSAGVACASDETASDVSLTPPAAVAPSPATGETAGAPSASPPPPQPAATPAEGSTPVAVGGDSTATASPVEMPESDAMVAADFPTPPARDLPLLARQMRWDGAEPPPAAGLDTANLEVGDVRNFWTLDYPRRTMVRNPFRLAAISDNAYWWIGEDLDVDDDDLNRTVEDAEARVFPRVGAVFAASGGSGDAAQRLHVINGRIPGIGGYVSGSDLHPASVSPYSNEVEAIYINTRAGSYGGDRLLHILAHELQHSLHQRADESEATWLNEGLAELAVGEAGYPVGSIHYYLRRPNSSLVNWPDDLGDDIGLNYGAAALFAHYLREHYAPDGGLQDLLAIPDDGIAAVDRFLAQRGATTTAGQPADFHTTFADWMAANRLDLDSGAHGYAGLDVQATLTQRHAAGDDPLAAELAQYAVDYVEIRDASAGDTIHFDGAGITPLLPAEIPGECWWSNRGDSISATLTRRLTVPADAPGGPEPLLTYRYWHDIEEEWDYLYVAASTDGGATWDVLPATGATDSNPVGNSYGFGYTGASGGWRDGEASMAPYAGQEALVRFHYVTDDAINGPGLCVREMHVSWDEGDAGPAEWTADGFVPVNNRVRQDWLVWVLAEGSETSAVRMQLEWDTERSRRVGSATAPDTSGGRLVLAVAPLAPATMEPGEYRVWVDQRR